MTIEEMKARKIELGLTNEMIASASGVPLSTVRKLFGGVTKAPRRLTIEAITRVLADTARAPIHEHVFSDGSGPGYPPIQEKQRGFHEASVSYNTVRKDIRHTIDEYYALPEDQRVELIDGVFYDMGAPAVVHQIILLQLYKLFEECTAEHGEKCEVFVAPCDVRLDMDIYTMLQPDLFILCRDYDIRAIRIEGAPDFVLEILSPSTRSKDMLLKLYKYQNAGVREYWIVDPKYRRVTVHLFDAEEYNPEYYDFDSVIPVGISGGRCAIDFSRVLMKISRYYEN